MLGPTITVRTRGVVCTSISLTSTLVHFGGPKVESTIMDSHQDQDSPAADPHEPRYEEFDAVDILVRGGYPIEREDLFVFTKKLASDRIAKGVPTIVPSSKDDRPMMLKLMDDLFRRFPDLECSAISNPADPKRWTYFVATDQGRYVDIPLAQYRDMVRRQDFWNPEPKLRLQETIADAEVRDLLQKIGARLHPFRTVFWD